MHVICTLRELHLLAEACNRDTGNLHYQDFLRACRQRHMQDAAARHQWSQKLYHGIGN